MIKDYQEATRNIRDNLKYYIRENNIKSLIIGVSGGIDSTLCCILAKPVCDILKIPLIGRSLPIITNTEDEIRRANEVGLLFCTYFKKANLKEYFKDLSTILSEEKTARMEDDLLIRAGNIKARLRMIYLYDLAKLNKGIVLSTDNYTEYLLGFWTLHGDVGDFGMMQNLLKTEVYGISKFLLDNKLKEDEKKHILKECIEAKPTDGLGITETDLDQIGANSYEEVDRILMDYLNNCTSIETMKELEKSSVIQMYLRTKYKRQNPFNIPRKKIINGDTY